jgi:hypothetical protein
MKKYSLILIITLFGMQACSVFSNPECELINHVFVMARNDNSAYVQMEIQNISEKDYAYAVTALVKAKLNGSIVEQSQGYLGSVKAQASLTTKAQFSIITIADDFDSLEIILTWKDDGNTQLKKEYVF